MDYKKKRILLIITFLILVIGIAFLIYYVFFRAEETVLFQKEETETGVSDEKIGIIPKSKDAISEIKEIEKEKKLEELAQQIIEEGVTPEEIPSEAFSDAGIVSIQPLVDVPVIAPVLSKPFNSVVYYNKNEGKFFKVDKNKKISLLSDKIFASAEKVQWSNSGNKAVIEFPDKSKVIYDFRTKKQVTLPKEMQEFSFSKDENKLAFKWISKNEDENYVGTITTDGSNVRFLERIGGNKDRVKIEFSPTSKVVATFRDPANKFGSYLYFIGQNDENFSAAVVEGYGVEMKWSSTGAFMLYNSFSAENDYRPRLWVATGDDAGSDEFGLDRKEIPISTWSEKCVFNKEDTIIYCAVPISIDKGAGIFKNKNIENTDDSIYKIDLKTMSVEMLTTPTYGDLGIFFVTAKDLFLSEDEKTLFFVNAKQNTLMNINLP